MILLTRSKNSCEFEKKIYEERFGYAAEYDGSQYSDNGIEQ